MKEIKFRAFTDGKMYDVNVLVFLGGKLKEVLVGSMDMPIKREPHEVTLMQFTGLKDKNGKEIYEGDYLSDEPDGEGNWIKHRIIWDEDIAGFRVQYLVDVDEWDNHDEDMFWLVDGDKKLKDFEVCGNLYENPELLKP